MGVSHSRTRNFHSQGSPTGKDIAPEVTHKKEANVVRPSLPSSAKAPIKRGKASQPVTVRFRSLGLAADDTGVEDELLNNPHSTEIPMLQQFAQMEPSAFARGIGQGLRTQGAFLELVQSMVARKAILGLDGYVLAKIDDSRALPVDVRHPSRLALPVPGYLSG